MRTILLIPPLGHFPAIYDVLIKEYGSDYQFLTYEFPYTTHRSFLDESPEKVLDLACDDLIEFAGNHGPVDIIAGISIGATLGLKIREILKPQSLVLFSPGGLKVRPARKSFILRELDRLGEEAFCIYSLGIDPVDKEKSGFLRNFSDLQGPICSYWETYWRFWTSPEAPMKYRRYANFINASIDVDYERYFGALGKTDVIVWGGRDRIFSPKHLKRIIQLAPDTTIRVLDDKGHYIPLETSAHLFESLPEVFVEFAV